MVYINDPDQIVVGMGAGVNFNYETDQPLDDELEGMIIKIGPRKYLTELMAKFNIKSDKPIEELTDHECLKVSRAIYRNASDYRETIQ